MQNGSPRKAIVRYGNMEDVDTYPVTEEELCTLERGGALSILLSIALALLPAAASIFVCLGISDIKSVKVFCLVTVCGVAFALGGAICLLLWWRLPSGIKNLGTKIRKRGQAPAEVERVDENTEESE